MARRGHPLWLMGFAFALGFGGAVAEPALAAVASQAALAMVADPPSRRTMRNCRRWP
uniref:DUF1538 family protein n=1 Tax=Pantanalinema rosaneae TaxID=1620701 RepID=UPI003D6FDE8D